MQSAQQILERHYLETRAKILEIAATLDRIDRAVADENETLTDPRLQQLTAGIELLLGNATNRADVVQRHFSNGYDENWRDEMGI
ncbi:MAG: hypothetical protein AAFP69_15095 [Planctomycetota bacterium]